MSDCNLPIFTPNETITSLTQYELSQEESDLLKAGLYFLIPPDKIQKSKIFTTFEKTHCSFLNNLKAKETKSQIKVYFLYLANSYFCNYKNYTDVWDGIQNEIKAINGGKENDYEKDYMKLNLILTMTCH